MSLHVNREPPMVPDTYGTAEYWKQRYFHEADANFRVGMAAIAGWVLFVGTAVLCAWALFGNR